MLHKRKMQNQDWNLELPMNIYVIRQNRGEKCNNKRQVTNVTLRDKLTLKTCFDDIKNI